MTARSHTRARKNARRKAHNASMAKAGGVRTGRVASKVALEHGKWR